MILNRIASRRDLETHYSLIDLLEDSYALDVKEKAERDAMKQKG